MKTIVALLTIGLTGCITSIRPASVQSGPTPDSTHKARALLAQVYEAHGGDRWKEIESIRVNMNDHWQGLLGTLGHPWPETDMDIELNMRVGSFDSVARFEGGEHDGVVWGLQAWEMYEKQPGATPVFADNPDGKMVMAAIQYLTELPVRVQRIPLVAHAGTETIDGKTYETIFATWGHHDAHIEHDQYVIYVDPETHLIAKAYYTLREANRFITGAMHYDDYREVDGVQISYKQSITLGAKDDPDDYLHRITVKDVAVNDTDKKLFVADPSLPVIGDDKPSS